MARIQDFLRRVLEMSYRTDYGHWVFFRDSNPETLVSIRFDDNQDGAAHPPTCVIITPDEIKVQKVPGDLRTAVFPREKDWDAMKYIAEITNLIL